MNPDSRGFLVLIIYGVCASFMTLSIARTYLEQRLGNGVPIILEEATLEYFQERKEYSFLPLDEKYVRIKDENGKERIFIVNDAELLVWMKDRKSFSRADLKKNISASLSYF